jgi:hypothetical protein
VDFVENLWIREEVKKLPRGALSVFQDQVERLADYKSDGLTGKTLHSFTPL